MGLSETLNNSAKALRELHQNMAQLCELMEERRRLVNNIRKESKVYVQIGERLADHPVGP